MKAMIGVAVIALAAVGWRELPTRYYDQGHAWSEGLAGAPSSATPPGAVDPVVTQEDIDDTICVPGYSRQVRPPYSFTGPLKKRLMREQHPGEPFHDYELDHLVPLSIGGAPADPDNLWLEPWTGPMNASDKDVLEFVLWRMVCDHRIPLRTAQTAIARDWVAAYRAYATPANVERYHFHGDDDGHHARGGER